jgi:hypothetical protein
VIDNVEKLVSGKANHIKKSLGVTDLKIERTETALVFHWWECELSEEEENACLKFISGLVNLAREKKRVTMKEKSVTNERYAFRCFLLRLGFIGDEFKAARKLLLKNLDGNSAFLTPPENLQSA